MVFPNGTVDGHTREDVDRLIKGLEDMGWGDLAEDLRNRRDKATGLVYPPSGTTLPDTPQKRTSELLNAKERHFK